MTLDPGFYDHTEAPWFNFTCDEVTDTTVVKQWMKEAAEQFAVLLSKRIWGGETEVETAYLHMDGMTGVFVVTFEHHRPEQTITVHRGEQTVEPNNA